MLKNIFIYHILKEYIILFLGLIFSIFLASLDTQYLKAYVPYANLALYMVLTGHIFILILLPIIGHFIRATYLYSFIILSITHIANILLWLGDAYSLNNVIRICWPMPVSFICALLINLRFWRKILRKLNLLQAWLLNGSWSRLIMPSSYAY